MYNSALEHITELGVFPTMKVKMGNTLRREKESKFNIHFTYGCLPLYPFDGIPTGPDTQALVGQIPSKNVDCRHCDRFVSSLISGRCFNSVAHGKLVCSNSNYLHTRKQIEFNQLYSSS